MKIRNYFKVFLCCCVLPLIIMNGSVTQAASSTCGGWSITASQNGGESNQLNSVVALSANDAWAVGSYANGGSHGEQTLIEQWNGTSWNIVSSPSPYSNDFLSGVAAESTNNVWAVGSYSGHTAVQTLIEQWNGRKWKVIPSPNAGTSDNRLDAITIISANDIWAVGNYYNLSVAYNQTLIEHWNGTSWSVVPSSSIATADNYLLAVTAASTNNVWAVGYYQNLGNSTLTLIEHWNGKKWKIIPSLSTGQYNYLNDAAAVSTSDVWAVGNYNPNSGPQQTLIEQWNGTSWNIVPSPNPSQSSNAMNGVAVVSANNVWAVGEASSNGDEQTLTEQWNGTTWNVVPSPSPSAQVLTLYGVAAIPSNNVWTVGNYYPLSGRPQTLSEFYC